jgi:cbb3-type cytochrome oxidase subunit 3
MKQLSNSSKQTAMLLIGFFTSAVAWAQDSISAIVDDFEIDTTVIDDGPYYAQLWFWVVIGIVFLLVLLALLRGGGKKRVEIKDDKKVEEKAQVQEKVVEEKTQGKKVEVKTQEKKIDKED